MKKSYDDIELLIFDFDFTLVDSMQAMLKVRKELREKHGRFQTIGSRLRATIASIGGR